MRIALLTPEYVTLRSPDGGLANYIKKTGRALSLRWCEVWVFVESDHDAIWQDDTVMVCEVKCDNILLKTLSKFPYLQIFIPVLIQILSSRKLAKKFWSIYDRKPFDVIQAASYMASGYALLKNERVPVVCRASSYTPVVRSAYGRQGSLGEHWSDRLEVRQVAGADASFAPSEFVAKTFLRTKSINLTIIRTPIDIHEVALDYSYFEKDKPMHRYLLFFGTLSRIKGIDLLADVLPALFERYKDLAMVFVGRDDGLPGGQKVFSYILAKCEKYRERIHYHPALAKSQLYPFITNSEAVLMPSRVDNYPNACLEAQTLGIPVIGTYDSSLDEMIVDGETGFLAKNGSAESIKEAIERCLNLMPEEREIMRQKITSHIDTIKKEDRIGQLINYYKETIKEFKKKHGK